MNQLIKKAYYKINLVLIKLINVHCSCYLCMLCVSVEQQGESKCGEANVVFESRPIYLQYISEVYIAQHVMLHVTPVLGGRSA